MEINGLPLHALVVHAAVVLTPVALVALRRHSGSLRGDARRLTIYGVAAVAGGAVQVVAKSAAATDLAPTLESKSGDAVSKILDNKSNSFGFNAATEKYEDLVAAGVIDPAKVTRTALQNAASIAGLMLTTEAMIADVQEEKGDGGMGGMGGGMGGMGMGM